MTQNDPTPLSDYTVNSTGPSPGTDHANGTGDQPSQRMLVLTFLGLIAGPLLALLCAIMGFVLILNSHALAGVIFLLVPTQIFLFIGLWAYGARKREVAKGAIDVATEPNTAIK